MSVSARQDNDRIGEAAFAPLVAAFPQPGALVASVIAKLQLAACRPPADEVELLALAELPRPWDPASCSGSLRTELWRWLDEVAVWINTQHLWNVNGPGVSECWSHHPHVVHDLAVVACARLFATIPASRGPLDDWHRATIPLFLDRLREHLGEGCAPGRHGTRPRADRDQRLLADRRRQEVIL